MNDILENKLYVEANLIPPQILSEKIYPTKDAYMDQGNPVEPFGDREYLKINSSDARYEDETKIYMTFHVPKLPLNIYDNFKGAYLTLYSNNRVNRDVTILLRNHYDNGWRENGTTWMAQPYEHQVDITSYIMEKGTNSVKINITDFYLSYENQEFDVAYVIKEDPNDGHQKPIQFFSKESINKNLRPCIEVLYEKYPEFLDFEDVYARFKSRYTVSQGYDPYEPNSKPELPAVLEVINKFVNIDLPSKFQTHSYDENSDLDCVVTVKRKGWKFFDAKFTGRQFVPNENEPAPYLPSVVHVKSYVADAKDGEEGIDPRDPSIEHILYPYIKSQVRVHTYVPMEYPELECSFRTQYRVPSKQFPDAPSINCQFTIKKYIADTKEGEEYQDPDNSIIEHVPYSFLPSSVTVQNTLYGEINGTFIIPYYFAELPRGSELKQDENEPWKLYIEAPELDSQVTVRRNVPSSVEEAPALDCKFSIKNSVADLLDGEESYIDQEDPALEHVPYTSVPCILQTRFSSKLFLDAKFKVKEYRADSGENPDPIDPEAIIHKPAKILDCTVNVRTKITEDLNSMFEIPGYPGSLDLDSKLEVPGYDGHIDLDCKFSMFIHVPNENEPAPYLEAIVHTREVDRADMLCRFQVRTAKYLDAKVTGRVKKIHDLVCTFEIDRDSVGAYSYII